MLIDAITTGNYDMPKFGLNFSIATYAGVTRL